MTSPTLMLWSPPSWTAVVRHSSAASAHSRIGAPVSGPARCGTASSWPSSGRPRVASHRATFSESSPSTDTAQVPASRTASWNRATFSAQNSTSTGSSDTEVNALGHRMADTGEAGGDHDDPGRKLAGRAPEGGDIDCHQRPGSRYRRRRRAGQRTKPTTTPTAALTAPPNRNQAPALLFVITTLPEGVPIASTYAAMNQPAAGISPPPGLSIPQLPSTQVTRISAQKISAATGTAPAMRLYWKLPTTPSAMPSRNSIR